MLEISPLTLTMRGPVVQEKRNGGEGEMTTERTVLKRDTNYLRSDEILHWACATREILHRVAEGLPLADDAP